MNYVKKRYRIFYLPVLVGSLFMFLLSHAWDFLLTGHLKEADIVVSIEGFDGVYKKVYQKGDQIFVGETVEKIKS